MASFTGMPVIFSAARLKLGDAPVQINRVYTVRDVVQYDLILIVEAFIGRDFSPESLKLNLRRRKGSFNVLAGSRFGWVHLVPIVRRPKIKNVPSV